MCNVDRGTPERLWTKKVSSMFLGPAAYGRMQPDLDRTYMAAAVECCVCTAAGAAPLRRRCCDLRRSARDRRDAEGCSSSSVAARDASTRRAPDYASQHERCFRHCCVESGSAPYPQRVGTPPKARLWKPYAPARSSRADACERPCLCRPHRRIRPRLGKETWRWHCVSV